MSDNLADICKFLNRIFNSYPSIRWPIRYLTWLELNHKLLEGSLKHTSQACDGIKASAPLGGSLFCNVTVSSASLLPGLTEIYDVWSSHEVQCRILSCVIQKGLPPERLQCSELENEGIAKQKRKSDETGPEEQKSKKYKATIVSTPLEATQLVEETPKSDNTRGGKVPSLPWQFRITSLLLDQGSSQPRQSPIDTISSSLEI